MNKANNKKGGDEFVTKLQSKLNNLDQISGAGIKDLKDLKILQQLLMQQEVKRLERKYGKKHHRIKQLKKLDNRNIIQELEHEIGIRVKRKDSPGEAKKTDSVELEDINGIGPSRAEKLRKGGVKDVEAFVNTGETKLKKIIGNVNIRKMKKGASFLLKKKKGKS